MFYLPDFVAFLANERGKDASGTMGLQAAHGAGSRGEWRVDAARPARHFAAQKCGWIEAALGIAIDRKQTWKQ